MAKPEPAFAPYWGTSGETTMIDISAPGAGGFVQGDMCRGQSCVSRSRESAVRPTSPVMPLMPGSPDAVKNLPSHVPSRELSARAVAPVVPDAKRASAVIAKIAWIPKHDLGHTDWLATGRRLGAIGRCSQWWIGDWVRYGASRWGEKYAEAARVTGYDVASLRNMAWVASRFDLSLRNDKLSWSHHVLLAPLEAEKQREWLGRASEERLSVADLRLELRASREGDDKSSSDPPVAAHDSAGAVVCPQCGHTLHSSTE
jgi:hypothetical protein